MQQPAVDTTCFLCGAPAKSRKTDSENRRLFNCSSSGCGEYEISRRAMKEREYDEAFKRKASALAARVNDPDKLVEIIVPHGGEFATLEVVERPARLR